MADEPRLSKRAEQLLASFPVPERDWEEQARAVEARLSTVAAGSTEARWLAAPLPAEATEGDAPSSRRVPSEASAERKATVKAAAVDTPFPFAAMSSLIEAAPSETHAAASPPAAASRATSGAEIASGATSTPVPNTGSSQSLSALARSVAQKAGRAQAPRDIARESLSVAAAARSQSDAIVERVRTARPAPPPPPSQRPPHANPPAAPSASQGQHQLGPWIAIGGLGVAAAVALWVFFGKQPAPTAAPVAPPAQVLAQREAAPPAAPEAVAVAPTQPNTQAASQDVDPLAKAESPPAALAASALPLAPRAGAGASSTRSAGSLAAAAPGATPAPVAAASPPAGAGSARPAPERIVLEDTPASGKPNAPTQNGLRPASGSPSSGGLPDRPSTGAVQAAVGSVMGAARACVVGGVATPAQVTFGSDGTVRTVTVSGPNAGTAAASCIDAALRRARVAPFTSPNFSLMVWVRP